MIRLPTRRRLKFFLNDLLGSFKFYGMPRLARIFLWLFISLLGAAAVSVAAFQRNEPVNALWLVVARVCTFAVAYRFYSAWLMAKVLTIDDRRAPAPVTCRDGKSLGQILREELNPFIGWVAMVRLLDIITILLAVLGLVVVKALAESPWGLFTIACTIPLAFVMGVMIKSGKVSVTGASLFGVVGLIGAVYGGKLLSPEWTAALTLKSTHLAWAIMNYGFTASVLPVWMLLAPRDYLSTFMKLAPVAVLGIFIVILHPPLHMPAITPFIHGGGFVVPGPVFPFVCISIACGAISGFHSLIASGTTPKLLAREKDIRLIGYGAMVVKMLVALMAIIADCALQPGEYFAINSPIGPNDAAAVTTQIGEINSYSPEYAITEVHMRQLANDLGEPHMIGEVGGAPTFAVGMAHGWGQSKIALT